MRLDAHVHLWQYDAAQYGWITDEMSAIRRDLLPDDWREAAEPPGFDGMIAVQARQTLEETRWLLELADEYEFIRGVVGWVDLQGPALDEQLEILCDHPKLVGVRHVVQDEPDPQFLLRDEVLRGISRLGKFDLTYDILVRASQLPSAIEMVEHFPSQRFVLDHIGKPDIAAGQMQPWATHMRELAAHENVLCKLSGMVTEADRSSWTPEQLHPYADVVLDAFGPQRVMIGSDWPVCLVAGEYRDVIEVVTSWLDDRPEQMRRAIMGGTCARAYHVETV